MHDFHSTPFLFSLMLLPCLPFLPRFIDASALHIPHELLLDKVSPNLEVSCIFRIRGS